MKYIILLLTPLCFISCKNEHTPRAINNLTIQKFTITNSSIRAIYPLNDKTVYYVGSNGDFGYTKNGGNSWTTKQICYNDTLTPHFRSIAFNGKDFFALSIGSPALLYKITEKNTTLVYTENHQKAFYDSMHFFDANNGIAIGDPTDNCLSIITTSDGGNTWNKIPCKELPKTADGEAAFAASNTNIKIVKNTVWIVTGGKKARVFKSDNKGKDWVVYNTPIVQGTEGDGIYSIDFYDTKNGIIIGGNYAHPHKNNANKAITNNGGKTWTLVANKLTPNYKSCVQYVPNTNGQEVFAVGKTGITYSSNGGKSWKDISKASYYSIKFVNKHTAWLSGNEKIGKLVLK